ncbi:MAG: pyridoxal phosphate-dependent aminotransferase [Candidatus Aegiribacteria sp.]|nr:pyridoxal phosphate-dependent aminotransferase [Candidatus Aegiribacteria sp.]
MNKIPDASKRVMKISKSAIHEMTRLSKQYDDVAFLSWAKPTSDTPEFIREAAVKAIRNGLTGGYSPSQGLPELREAICRKLVKDNDIVADITDIIVTVGAIEGLAAAVMAVIDPGDEVILPTPTYSTHARQVLMASGIPVFAPTIEDDAFRLDLQAISDRITDKTKAIMLCSPANPTGSVFPESVLRDLGEIALENNLFIITDEAYEYFVYDDACHFSIASIPELRKNVISCFTLTKTYAMTGWRIGYLHADSSIIPQINKAHIPLTICAPVVSQYAALAALQGSQECVEHFRKKYCSARDLMCSRLDELPDSFSYQKPEGSYLMFPKVLHTSISRGSLHFARELLHEVRVSVTPGIAFGPTGENHVRMSFCVPENVIEKAFDRIEVFFRK